MLPLLTCTKVFRDIPFAHRQPNHAGHCRFIHGHNWTFEFTFTADALDACGFIIDFGGVEMKNLKMWLELTFDHRLVLNENDPMHAYFAKTLRNVPPDLVERSDLAMLTFIPDCSCEGIAFWLHYQVKEFLYDATKGRVKLVKVVVHEDSKNSATSAV